MASSMSALAALRAGMNAAAAARTNTPTAATPMVPTGALNTPRPSSSNDLTMIQPSVVPSTVPITTPTMPVMMLSHSTLLRT